MVVSVESLHLREVVRMLFLAQKREFLLGNLKKSAENV